MLVCLGPQANAFRVSSGLGQPLLSTGTVKSPRPGQLTLNSNIFDRNHLGKTSTVVLAKVANGTFGSGPDRGHFWLLPWPKLPVAALGKQQF